MIDDTLWKQSVKFAELERSGEILPELRLEGQMDSLPIKKKEAEKGGSTCAWHALTKDSVISQKKEN